MRSFWVALALVFLPAASACTTTTPAPGTFQFLQWDGVDRVTFGFHDEYYSANVTTREVVEADGPTPYPMVADAPAIAVAPDGSLRLFVRTVEAGMMSSCTGEPSAYDRPVGVDLVDATGRVLRSWQGAGPDGLFRGAIWANATHGFVWEQPYVAPPAETPGDLSIVSWSTGAVEAHQVDVPAGYAWWRDVRSAPPLVGTDDLLLMGQDGALVIDPDGPTTRAIASPFPGGWTERAGDFLVFGRWDWGAGTGDLSVARVRIADGEVAWQVSGHGNRHGIVPRGVALVDERAGTLLRWRDGVALPVIQLGDDTDAFPSEGPPLTQMMAQGDFVAIGIRGHDERLLVLGPDLEVVLSASPFPEEDPDPSTADGPGEDDVQKPVDDTVDVALAPTAALAAIALAALAARRRL